jgi:hypothetical protein
MTHRSEAAWRLRGIAAVALGAGIPAIAFFAAPVVAEDYTNVQASGRVLSADGRAIVGATVQITSDELGFTRSALTNAAGAFVIPQLASGTYRFTVSADGYETYSEDGVLLSRTGASNQFTLVQAGVETVVVNAARVRTPDFETNTTGAAIGIGELSERVPVGRSLRDVTLMAPGVVQGSSSANGAFAQQVSISGASFIENAYYVNGLNITNFRMGLLPVEVPFDFYQSIEVKTGGYPAEFGRSTGGFVNATTKSGSNEFHASFTAVSEPEDLRGESPDSFRNKNSDATASRQEWVAQVSGPILEDRLFFYGLYNDRKLESFTPAADQDNATRVVDDSPFWGAKLDGYITDDHHVELTYFDTTKDTERRSLRYERATERVGGISGGTNARAGGENYIARYTGSFTPWFTFSAAYGENNLRDGQLPLDTTHERVLDYRTNSSGIDIGVNKVTDAMSFNDDERTFYRTDADFKFDLLGAHHLRVGYDHEENIATQTFETIGRGFFKFYRVPAGGDQTGLPAGTEYVTTRVYRNNGAFSTVNQAFYAEDQWSVFDDRMKLQLGARNDRFDNRNAAGGTFYDPGDQWAPRLGASGDLFGDGRTKLYGSYGRYYLPLPSDLSLKFAGSLVTFTRYNVLDGVNAADGTPSIGAAITTVPAMAACPDTGTVNCLVSSSGIVSDTSQSIAHNLKPQSADEFILGIEHRMSDLVTLGAYFTHRELDNVIEDVAIDGGARAYCVAAGFTQAQCAGIYDGGHQWAIVNPGEDVVVQLSNMPDGSRPTVRLRAGDLGYKRPRRDYDALTLTFDRAFDRYWSLAASYTWANLEGNYEGGVRSENGQLAVNTTADFDSPGFQIGADGYLPNHRRHTLKAYGSYQLYDWLTLGSNMLIQSPRKYSCIGIVPADIDPVAFGYQGYGSFCQGQVVQRGSAFEGDWLYQFDVSAALKLPVPGGFDASLRLDVFNVFDFDSASSFYEFGDLGGSGLRDPNFGKPVDYQSPRYARIQLQVGF